MDVVIRQTKMAFAALILYLSVCTTLLAQVPKFAPGDFFVALSNGKVEWRRADDSLVKTLETGNAGQAKGMAFDARGNLYVTHWWAPNLLSGNDVDVFNDAGIYLSKFGSGFFCNPTSIDFDSAGNAYVGHADCYGDVIKYDSAGNLLARFAVETEARGAALIDLAPDDCTLYYTSAASNIKRFDVCANRQLPNFNSVPLPEGSEAHGLRLLPNGGLLVAATGSLVQFDAGGNVVYNIDAWRENCWYAITADPVAGFILAGDYCSGNLYKFDLKTGAMLQQFRSAPEGTYIKGIALRLSDTAPPPPSIPPPFLPPRPNPSPIPPNPVQAACRMTGAGSVFFLFEGNEIRVTHGFQLRAPATEGPQRLEVNWNDPNLPGQGQQNFHLAGLTTIRCVDDPLVSAEMPRTPLDTLILTGYGSLNGIAGATIEAVFVDAGEAGAKEGDPAPDTATMIIRDPSNNVVLVVSGPLERGNQQMHGLRNP